MWFDEWSVVRRCRPGAEARTTQIQPEGAGAPDLAKDVDLFNRLRLKRHKTAYLQRPHMTSYSLQTSGAAAIQVAASNSASLVSHVVDERLVLVKAVDLHARWLRFSCLRTPILVSEVQPTATSLRTKRRERSSPRPVSGPSVRPATGLYLPRALAQQL